MNKVFITGVVADNPVYRMENEGIPHCYFRLCVRHKTCSGETRNEFFRVSAWHNAATWASEHLKRGQLIGVTGYLTQRNVLVGEETRSAVEIVAEEFQPMMKRIAEKPAVGTPVTVPAETAQLLEI